MGQEDQTKRLLLQENARLLQRLQDLERQQVQGDEDVSERERLYRSFVDDFRGIAFRGDMGFQTLLLAGSVEAITGYSIDEFLAGEARIDRITHPEDIPKLQESAAPLRTVPNYASEREYRIIRKDGGIRWVHEVIHNVCDQSGKPIAVQGVVLDITDRKQAEQAFRESEDRYRTLAESTTDVIYIVDESGRLLYVNRAAAEYFRSSPEALIGKGQHDLFPPEQAGRHLERIRRVFDTGRGGEMDERYLFGTNEVWLNVRSVPILDEQGRVRSMMGVCRDITARKVVEHALKKAHDELEKKVEERTAGLVRANNEMAEEIQHRRQVEAALRASEERYRSVVEDQTEVISRLNTAGEFVFVNDVYCRFFGKTSEELLGSKWQPVVVSEDVPAIEERLRALSRLQPVVTIENRVYSGSGRIRWMQFVNRGFFSEEGRLTEIQSVGRDISELREMQESVLQSRDQLRMIYDEMVEGLVITDIETKRFVAANASMCRMLGYAKEELLAASVQDIHPTPEVQEDLGRFQAVAEGRVSFNADRPVIRKDGSIFYADISGHRIFYGGRACVLALFRDITERKRVQEALERERQSLWHMLQASDHERRIISYEIHDGLAQYLAAAGMQLQVFEGLREADPAGAQRAYEAAAQLVSQSHSEARRLISEVRPPVIDEIGLETAISHLVFEQRRPGGPHIEFNSDVQFGRLPAILENSIYRIAQEALTNACKHSKSTKIKVALVQQDHEVCLEVRDWGSGFIPEGVGPDHFGLEGIRQRARLLGGRSTVESQPGAGTRVEVVVPLVESRL